MAIRADHSDLPADAGGWRPDEHPRFLPIFAEAWKARTEASWAKPIAGGTRMRLSKSGGCARDIGYLMMGLPESNPPTVSGQWRMGLGTLIHDEVVLPTLEAVLRERFGTEANIEVLVNLAERTDEWKADTSGRIDLVVVTTMGKVWPQGTLTDAVEETLGESESPQTRAALIDALEIEPRRIVVELKTVNGFGFKMQVGARGAAEGPKSNAIRQASLAAFHLDADELVLLYLSLECLSEREATKLGVDDLGKFGAEWTMRRDQYEPIAQAEIRRQQRIAEIVDEGKLPPRSMPDIPAKARIVDPSKGAWTIEVGGEVVESGTTWFCPYCSNRNRCIEDGPS